jgi:hypothetical protein
LISTVPFLEDITTLMEDGGLGRLNSAIFLTTKSTAPNAPLLASGEAVLTIVDTSGSGPENTQNAVITPAYIRPAAQLKARAHSPLKARALAQAAYRLITPIRNCWIVAGREYTTGEGLMSGWYRSIVPLQEPFDSGQDDAGNATYSFNIIAIRRP